MTSALKTPDGDSSKRGGLGLPGADAVDQAVSRLAHIRWASVAVILAFTALCVLPGFTTIPVLDGGEPGFAVAARSMVESGDLLTIRLPTGGDTLRWAPRGGYWLPALSALALDAAALWSYRLPSLLAALATPVLTWWAALAVARERGALLAGLLIAASGVFGLQARLAMPDAMTAALMTLAAGALVRLWIIPLDRPTKVQAAVFWLALAGSLLLRGALPPLAMIATALLLALRRPGLLGRLWSPVGFAAIAVAVLAWGGSGLAAASPYLTQSALGRLGVPFVVEAPPGTYFLLSPLLMGPAMTFAFVAVPWFLGNLGRPAVIFAFAWIAPAWLAAEFWPDKVPHLILPVLPAIALLTGTAIDRAGARIGGWISWFYSLGPLVWPPVVAVAMPAAVWYLTGRFPVIGTLFLVAAAVLGPVAWFWLRQGRAVASTAVAVVSAMLIYWAFFGAILPGLSGLRVAERIAEAATEAVACPPTVAVVGYPEESATWVMESSVQFAAATPAADFLDTDDCAVAAVERGYIAAFRQRADDLGLDLVSHGRIVGADLRKLRRVEVHVFTADEAES